MLQAEYRIDKRRIASSFAEAAGSYDAHASLQRNIADSLLAKIKPDAEAKRVLDLGSGTGYCTQGLQKLFPNAEIVSLDIASAMLGYARQRHAGSHYPEYFICADAESLPFTDRSFDVVFSSLAIQWCQNYAALFRELKRTLLPGGHLFITTFGPGTLQELEQAWRQIDDAVHVNQFQHEESLRQSLHNSGFAGPNLSDEARVRYYPSLASLRAELKSIGASNMNAGRGRGLVGRQKLRKLVRLFESNAEASQGIPVTYQIQFITARA